MWKQEAKNNLIVFMKAGLPYTVAGMVIVFSGLYALKKIFFGNEYLVAILFVWLAVFWGIYQPLFRHRIHKVKNRINAPAP
ncbi:MAG: hypothetical protein V1793_01015 [Pseudomonadota bacterium]